jgi:hypothetical protein
LYIYPWPFALVIVREIEYLIIMKKVWLCTTVAIKTNGITLALVEGLCLNREQSFKK